MIKSSKIDFKRYNMIDLTMAEFTEDGPSPKFGKMDQRGFEILGWKLEVLPRA